MATTQRPSIAKRTSRASSSASTAHSGAPRKASPASARGGRTTAAARSEARRPTRATTTKTPRRRSARTAEVKETVPPTYAEPEPDDGGLVRWTTIPLPIIHTWLAVPSIQMAALRSPSSGLNAMAAQTRWAAQAARANLPPADRLLYYGGVGAMALLGVLEWPVAVVAAAGLWIASRAAERQRGRAAPA
jgi:hypothetical protein